MLMFGGISITIFLYNTLTIAFCQINETEVNTFFIAKTYQHLQKIQNNDIEIFEYFFIFICIRQIYKVIQLTEFLNF